MDTARHSREDRLAIASLTGLADHHVNRSLDGTYSQAVAVEELRAVSDNGHLLAHAIGHPEHFMHRKKKALLLAAGANPDDLDEVAGAIAARAHRGPPVGRLG